VLPLFDNVPTRRFALVTYGLIAAIAALGLNLLLGYTGIVSFAHTMFFGIGGYGAGLALYNLGPSWISILLGTVAALALAVALALVIGLFSLRVRAIFFAMITLAVASAFSILASQLSPLTGGEDGRTFRLPEHLRPGFHLPIGPFTISGRCAGHQYVRYDLDVAGSPVLSWSITFQSR